MRNYLVACIFATIRLHNTIAMKRDVFQAIADPTRRAILLLIASQTMTPNSLADHFETTRQAVSKHIRYLVDCNVVRQEKVGREIYYGLNMERMDELNQWMEKLHHQWEVRFEQLDQVLDQLKSQKNEI